MIKRKSKRGQEEMVGFALIIVLVAVILIIFLGISLGRGKKIEKESYEVESFLSTVMQYTSECKNSVELLSIQKLMFACYEKQVCENGKDSCQILEKDVTGMLKEAWPIADSPVKGYEFGISVNNKTLITQIKQGNLTQNYKGTSDYFSRSGTQYAISVKIYY